MIAPENLQNACSSRETHDGIYSIYSETLPMLRGNPTNHGNLFFGWVITLRIVRRECEDRTPNKPEDLLSEWQARRGGELYSTRLRPGIPLPFGLFAFAP